MLVSFSGSTLKLLDKGETIEVDATFDNARPEDYDAVVIPGGVVNSEEIRMIPQARAFVRAIDRAHKPVAVSGHGGWLLISTGIVKGHRMTGHPSLRDDICNAGGRWVDARVVEDRYLISCGKPEGLSELSRKLMARLWMCGEPR
jgi:protease I